MEEKYSVKLKHPRSLYCPVLSGEMTIISEEVSELGFFSKIVIWAIGKGYRKEEIAEITGMPMNIVEDETEYLTKIELIDEVNQTIKLTELGSSFYRKIVAVENFNERRQKVLVNCVSGEIKDHHLPTIEKKEIPANEIVLKQRIILDLYGNLNPSNSKQFLLERYDLSPLTEGEQSLLDVSLKLLFEKDREKMQYIHYEVGAVPFIPHNGVVNWVEVDDLTPREEKPIVEETHSLLPFMYPIQKGKLHIKHTLLDQYRHVLHTLEKLEQFDDTLISDKATILIELYKEEQSIQQHLSNDMYFDSVSGVLATGLNPMYRQEKSIRNEVEVLPNYDVEDILQSDLEMIVENLTNYRIDDSHWQLRFVAGEQFYLKVNENPANIFQTVG